MAGIMPEMIRERVFGLARQRDPVDEEQPASDDPRLE